MAGVLLLTLGALTWRQSGVYRSSDQVWIDTLQKNPECWIAHNNLGDSYARQGRIDEAFSHLREAVRLKSDDEEIHNNLGVVLARKGQVEEAILHFREAVRLKPDCAKAHHNWGLALASQGRMQEAIAHYREASRIKAGHARGSLDIALTGQ
jgi:Tfp pilus assembly protein PilF